MYLTHNAEKSMAYRRPVPAKSQRDGADRRDADTATRPHEASLVTHKMQGLATADGTRYSRLALCAGAAQRPSLAPTNERHAVKEPGLDGRHRSKDGTIQQKRSDTQNGNLPMPIPGFSDRTTLRTIRERTGQISEKRIRDAVRDRRK
jgi:hypothetical protein